MGTLESVLEAKCVQYALDECGWQSAKLDRPPNKDWPDRCFFGPARFTWLVEFKQPGETPRKRQDVIHKRLAALGHKVSVIETFAQFKSLMDRFATCATAARLGGTKAHPFFLSLPEDP